MPPFSRFLSCWPSTIPPAKAPKPLAYFTDIAKDAGLTMTNTFGGVTTKKYIIETTGTGVAIFDYDNDGWPDIFIVNGTKLEGFPADQAPTNHLYHNNHDGTFTDVTQKSGLAHTGWGQGVCVGDYDNDGFEDLYVTYYGKNVLYHNNGDGTFSDVSDQAGVSGSGKAWGTGCAFLDYDRDGHLDLMVANYVDLDLANTPGPGDRPNCLWKGVPVMCGPQGLPGSKNILYHNRGDGTFENVSTKTHIDQADGHYAFSVTTLDYDDDGWPDIFVACDSTPSILYHNNRDGTFKDVALTAGAAFNEDGRAQAGMGSTVADFNGDGRLDIFKTNFSDDTATLYRNNGDGTFDDVTYPAGLGLNTQYLGWGTMFLDFDNDGWPDLLLVNGHVYPEVDSQHLGSNFQEPRILYHNNGNATFTDISATRRTWNHHGSFIPRLSRRRSLERRPHLRRGQQHEHFPKPAREPSAQRQSLGRVSPDRRTRRAVLDKTTCRRCAGGAIAGREKIHSRRHRRAHSRESRQPHAGRRSPQRLQLHFQQRHARALRPGRRNQDGLGRSPLAQRPPRKIRQPRRRRYPPAKRGLGDRRARRGQKELTAPQRLALREKV